MWKLNHQLQNTWRKSIAHKHSCLTGKLKAKNPNYNILCISIESRNNIIQRLVHQALSTINNHYTLSWRNLHIYTPISCLLIACLHCAIPTEEDPWMNSNWPCLDCAILIGNSNVCQIHWMHHYSHKRSSISPFHLSLHWVSSRIDMQVVNCCICLVASESLVVN